MATFTELAILREEERVLMKIASKLNDQLNRLKVEELALKSMIRRNNAGGLPVEDKFQESAKKQARQQETKTTEHKVDSQRKLDLNVASNRHNGLEVEEEEEDDDGEAMETEEAMKHDQLTAFLEQMELQYQK